MSYSHLYIDPSRSRPKHLQTRPKGEFTDGWIGWIDGMDRISKVSLNFGRPEKKNAEENKCSTDGWDGMRWDGVSKVSFNFVHTLYVYR